MKKSENEEIKAAIENLHKRGSGDFQTLYRQVEKRRKKVTLNLPQMVAAMSKARFLFLEWGRGTGKTTMRGYRWGKIVQEMPRSTGLFIGPSYQFILTRIVPSLVQGLEMFGMYEGLHYFIGQQPPRSWRKFWGRAYQPPKRFDKYITFFNGVGAHLISHDVKGDGRGLNSDWLDGDEAALLDPSKLQENTGPTKRGTNKQAFKNSYLFVSEFYTSSTPVTQEGEWFTAYEEKALSNPGKINFISATCEHNLHNLADSYLEEAELNAYSHWVFLAEYKNVRPKFTKDGFYALLDIDRHGYSSYNYGHYVRPGQRADCRGDEDIMNGVPLILGVDWGAAINCLTVNQYLKSIHEYRTLKSMHVLGDEQKIQDDLFEDFHQYYQYHQPSNNKIYLWYDNTGNLKTGNTRRTRAEQARDYLQERGWRVNLMTNGFRNPMHEAKHRLWEMILRGDLHYLPTYRINKHNCIDLYASMRHAKTKVGRNGEIKKDKSSERSTSIPRQHATDLSDANDAPIYGMFRHFLRYRGAGALPGMQVDKR